MAKRPYRDNEEAKQYLDFFYDMAEDFPYMAAHAAERSAITLSKVLRGPTFGKSSLAKYRARKADEAAELMAQAKELILAALDKD